MSGKKLFLFDADETLWHSEGKDWVSSVGSDFELAEPDVVVRKVDGKRFVLDQKTHGIFLESAGEIGIVSDNYPGPVKEVLVLFGLWDRINQQAFNVRLWKGHCFKEIMVQEILAKEQFKNLKPNDVYWFDDKDYSAEAKQLGVNFICVGDV